MKIAPAALLLPLVLASLPVAQSTRAASRPPAPRRPALVAPRLLAELGPGRNGNGGARAAGDLDGDGDQDLVTLTRRFIGDVPSRLQSWKNDGRGHFTLAHELVLTSGFLFFEFAHVANLLELEDLDRDGVLDVVYERFDLFGPPADNGVVVHFGLGNGSFGPPVRPLLGERIVDFGLGDADGDGDLDVLLARPSASVAEHTALQWWHLSARTFMPGPELDVGRAVYHLRLIDLDGDARDDLVASSFDGFDELRVFRSTGPSLIELGPLPLAAELADINQTTYLGDLDSDGDEDLLFVMASRFQPWLHVGPTLVPGRIQDLPSGSPGALGDWDADGDLDFVSSHFSWLENVGGASFAPAGTARSESGGVRAFVLDVDGDGHADALSEWTLFTGDGGFPLTVSPRPATELFAPGQGLFEDLDRDGDLDSIFQQARHLNLGDGSFVLVNTPVLHGAEDLRPRGFGDFDGDGFRDLLVAAFDGSFHFFVFDQMRLFLGGESGYELSTVLPSTVEMLPATELVGDLDGDGDQDLLDDGGYWANDGQGVFGSAPVAAFAGLPLVAQDLDADADLDLVVSSGGRVRLLRNDGGLVFTGLDLGPHEVGARVQFLDVDEDGDLDFASALPSTPELTLRLRTGAAFDPPFGLAATGINGAIGQLDVNGDGALDLACGRAKEGTNSLFQCLVVWPRLQGANFGRRIDWLVPTPPRHFGDIDGDGDRDVLGDVLVENLARDASEAGSARQYAPMAANAGTGGIHAVLGARGPFAPGEPAMLALGRGRGATTGWILIGTGRTSETVLGLELVLASRRLLAPIALDGATGAAGAGAVELPLRIPPAWFARTLQFQAVLVDPAGPNGLVATNGVEVRFGTGALVER